MSRSEVAAPVDVTVPDRDHLGHQVHLGALLEFTSGDPFDFERFQQLVRARIHLVPRYRQTLVGTPLGLSSPVWQDDPDFDLAYHVRHAGLPAPGTRQQLEEYAARVLSRELDRRKPPWELYVIEGLEDGGVAILTKHHRALVDGMDGLAMTTVLLDLSPEDADDLPPPQPWTPEPAPGRARLAQQELTEVARSPAKLVGGLQRLANAPMVTARRLAQIGQGVVSVAATNIRGRERTAALQRQPGIARRFVTTSVPLADLRLVKETFDATVNDAILAVVGDTVGRLLRSRGERTSGSAVRIMVPVSVESDDERLLLGSQVVAVFVDVPVDQMDPVERLHDVAMRMADIKRSHHAVGARFLVDLGSFAAPTIQGMAARLVADPALYDLVVTNVPGPQVPIWCLGSRMTAAYPYQPLAGLHALSVGVSSLDGTLNVAFTADYDAVPEADDLRDHLQRSVAELRRSAEAQAHRREVRDRGGVLRLVEGDGEPS